jgi:hypothetical protein
MAGLFRNSKNRRQATTWYINSPNKLSSDFSELQDRRCLCLIWVVSSRPLPPSEFIWRKGIVKIRKLGVILKKITEWVDRGNYFWFGYLTQLTPFGKFYSSAKFHEFYKCPGYRCHHIYYRIIVLWRSATLTSANGTSATKPAIDIPVFLTCLSKCLN